MSFSIRTSTPADAAGVLAVYRPVVQETPTTFEIDPPSEAQMAERIATTLITHPWLVAEIGGVIAGYAYATRHRTRSAYQWCTEVSAYVDGAHHRRGVGRALYRELLERLAAQGFVNAYAGITLPNNTSVAFHESMAFVRVGVYPRIGFKMGEWHDVGWWWRRIRDDTSPPESPRLR